MTKYVIISGVDGSGKTTVINSLKEKLEKEGKSVDYIWM
ncbi:MAG: adenylyl-sulfate kinase [Prevotellaceae bacterium]|nr:adenylyl-sulfate kinase [Prevotellaceae bacterium]